MNDTRSRGISGVTVRIDRLRCVGTANCIKIAPEVFVLDEESLCTFVETPADISLERLIDACAACPVDALTVVSQKGDTLVPKY